MKAVISMILLMGFVVPMGAQNVFENIEKARRLDLASAYHEAGVRFQELGQKERGAQFIEAAKQIYPGFTPDLATSSSTTSAVAVDLPELKLEGPIDPLTGIPDRLEVRNQNIDGQRFVRLQFSKLVRGFLGADAQVIGSVVADNLAGPGFEQGLTNAQVQQGATEFFAQNTAFTRWSPSRLFHMGALEIAAVQDTPDFILTASTNPETRETLKGLLTFWGEKVSFYFLRRGDNWFLAGLISN